MVMDWSAYKKRIGGIKYWAQWFPIGRKPRFEVFVYVDCNEDIGQYYFAHYKNPSIMLCRNFHQLTNDFSFRPFCFETSEIQKYADLHKIGGPHATD